MNNRNDYKNNHIREHYDRINLTIPKGKKALLKEVAGDLDMSVNEYIYALICKDTATGKSQLKKRKCLTEEQIMQLDRWQIPAMYRQMIESFSGNKKDGYVIKLKQGYINDEAAGNLITVRTTHELRKIISKTHEKQIL